ncbi:MAG: DUF3467 domain-containing protein [Phycisphaeraceae bacterium]|nr:DUF3467 domain-containing protein [Phycisphaeraceae bacterium]
MSGTPNPNQQQQVAIRIDESKMVTTYANTIRTTNTQDEVILDFGLNVPQQGQDGQQAIHFGIGSRVVMNWNGAKRLAMTLSELVRRYEQAVAEAQNSVPRVQ